MEHSFVKAAFAAVFTTFLAGCSVDTVATHANAIDHSATLSHTDGDERGSRSFALRSPKSDHVSLKGDRSAAFLAAGKQEFTSRNYGLAEKNFRKVVEVRADSAQGWLGLAAAYDQMGRFDLADRAYDQLLELEASNPRVLNNIGYSYLLRGEYSKSRHYLNRAQSINPNLEEVQGNIHILEKILAG